MDLLSFIWTADPTKVRIGERERDEGKPKLLETTVGSVVPLLPVTPDRSSGELEASVDKLFDEGGSGEQADQGDSAGGGHGVGVQLVDVSAETVAEDVAPAELQRRKKRKTKVVDAAIQRLLAGVVPHTEVRGGVMPAFPFVSSFISTTPERDGGDYTELLAGANLQAEVDYVVRTSVLIMTNATTATPTDDPAVIAKEKLVSASVFGGDYSSAGGSHPIFGGFSDRTGGDFLVGGIRTVVDPDSNLQRIYVPHWNLFTEFNVGAARQISLGAEVRMRAEYNIKEKKRLKSVVEEKDSLLKSKCDEIKSLKAQLLIKEAEAAEAVHLAASVKVRKQEVADLDVVVTSVHELEVASFGFQEKLSHYENLTKRLEEFQDAQLKLLTHGMELSVTKCLHSSEYLSALGAAIGKAIEKGMKDGLAAGITHGVEGRTMDDVAAYNPFAEADYFSALQHNLAERLGLTESRPCVDQLMVPIHHSPDRVVVGATSLLFALDVSDSRVRKISENTVSQRLALRDVFTPISEPFSAEVLTGTGDDYEIAHTEGGEYAVADVEAVADEGADPFPDTILLSIFIRSVPRSYVTFLDPVADIPCSWKGVSITVSKPVCSFAQCFRDFVWSLPLRFELALVFRMACFVVLANKVSWTEACVSNPGVVISFHFRFAPCFLYCILHSLFLQESKLIPKASLFLTISTSAVLKVGMPISAAITAFVPYVNENGVSLLLDLIMVRCAHKTCEISSTQFLFLSPNHALIPSSRLLFALSTRPLAWGYLKEAKH
nr:hypothetical protein [Tanacetum cinerariifolium]